MNPINESDVKAFVEQAARTLLADFKAGNIYLAFYASIYRDSPGLGTDYSCAVSLDSQDQITRHSLGELTTALRESISPDAILAEVSALRKKADELEASIAAEVVS